MTRLEALAHATERLIAEVSDHADGFERQESLENAERWAHVVIALKFAAANLAVEVAR